MHCFRISGEIENAIGNCQDCSISVPKSEIQRDEIDDAITRAMVSNRQYEVPLTKKGVEYERLIREGTTILGLMGMVYRYGGKIHIEIENADNYKLYVRYNLEDMNARLYEYNDQISMLEQSGDVRGAESLKRTRDELKGKIKNKGASNV